MAELQEGISSPQVQKVQGLINKYYQAPVVAEDGEFDSKMTAAVKRFQKDVKIRQSGAVDAGTLKLLINPPKEQAHLLKYKGKELYLSEADWKAFCKGVCDAAKPTVDGYRNRAQEARNLWDAHNSVRKDTFFMIPAMVDLWGGAKFPPESVIAAGEAGLKLMEAALAKGDPVALGTAIEKGGAAVAKAITAVKLYRDNMYAGGDLLIKDLNTLKDGCVLTLEVSAAIATGGSSVAVTGGVMAGLGSYKEVLNQIDKAGTTPNFSTTDAFESVLLSGAIEGIVGALLHDQGFCGKLTKGVSESIGSGVAKNIANKVGKDLVAKIVEKIIKNGADKGIEEAIKQFVQACKPGSKVTLDKAVDEIGKKMIEGAAFGAAFGTCDKQLEAFGKDYSKYLSAKDFKGLGKVEIDKAVAKGGEKYFEEALKRAAAKVLPEAAENPQKAAKFNDAVAAEMKKDPKLNAELAAFVKAKKLE